MKIYLSLIFLMLLLCGILAGCAGEPSSDGLATAPTAASVDTTIETATEDTSATTEGVTSAPHGDTETKPDPTPAYQEVLTEYTAACMDGNYANTREQYQYANNDMISLYHDFGSFDLYYAYYDIDHNGIEELIIGDGASAFDIYAFDGEKAVKLVNEPALGVRAQLAIMKTGELYVTGSSGADSSVYYMVRLKDDGCFTESVFYYEYDYMEYGSIYQGMSSSGHTVLTEDEFQMQMDGYTEIVDFPWSLLLKAPMTREEAYQEILNEYMAAASAMIDGNDSADQYPHAQNAAMFNVHGVDAVHFLYLYYDIDGNGTAELLIGYQNEKRNEFTDGYAGLPCVVDVYTYDGTQAVQLFREPALGDTAKLTILNNGELYFKDDRDEGGKVIIAQIASDGYSMEVLHSYQTRLENGTRVYYNDTETWTEQDFPWTFPSRSVVDNIQWTYFTSRNGE